MVLVDPTDTKHPSHTVLYAQHMPELNLPHANDALASHLERVAAIQNDRRPAGIPADAELAALLPCTVSAGDVVVSIWQVNEDANYILLRADGTLLEDTRALREALVLIATVEAIEEMLSPLRLRESIDLLLEWQAAAKASKSDALDAASTELELVVANSWTSIELLQKLEQELGGDGEGSVRVAHARRMDLLSSMTISLEESWTALEGAAAAWASKVHLAEPELVQQLITTLGSARRGALAEPMSTVVERGRLAGEALADDVLAAPAQD
jgi:hypothetical protein